MSEKNKTELYVNLWTKDGGHSVSHKAGLSKDDIAALRALKEGDRLVLFPNKRQGETQPQYTLRKHQPRFNNNEEGGL
jgi:hypothetical protein